MEACPTRHDGLKIIVDGLTILQMIFFLVVQTSAMNNQKFPASFEQRMRTFLGVEWDNFATAHEQSSPISIRVNPRKFSEPNYQSRIPWTYLGLLSRRAANLYA
jgi:hypothetical protein